MVDGGLSQLCSNSHSENRKTHVEQFQISDGNYPELVETRCNKTPAATESLCSSLHESVLIYQKIKLDLSLNESVVV